MNMRPKCNIKHFCNPLNGMSWIFMATEIFSDLTFLSLQMYARAKKHTIPVSPADKINSYLAENQAFLVLAASPNSVRAVTDNRPL